MDARTAGCDGQFVDTRGTSFAVRPQVKAVAEKGAEHGWNLIGGRTFRKTRFDIEFVVIKPGWTDDLVTLAVPSLCD
jgi:hypothetical protein